MTQEIKDKLQQAADAILDTPGYTFEPCDYAKRKGFLQGAQTILENPGEWGLETTKEALTGRNRILSLQLKNTELQSQLAKYREALERIAAIAVDYQPSIQTEAALTIAKEALKQESTSCPRCGYPLFNHLGKTCCQGCDYVKQQ